MGILDEVHAVVDGVPINLNQSRVGTYLRCRRKFAWGYYEDIVPDRPTYFFEAGHAVHKVIADVRGGKAHEADAGVQVVEEFKKDIAKFAASNKVDYDIVEEQCSMLQTLMLAYFEHWKDDPDPYKPIALEAAGRVEVGEGSNVFIVYRTDELALWHKQLWIVDHKTAKKLDTRDLLKYEMDLQITAYTYAISKQLGKRVSGAIIDLMVKTQVPQFHREYFTRSDEELVEFEEEFVELAREIKLKLLRVREGESWKKVFFKSPHECFSYGTCWYRDLCVNDTEIRRMAFTKRVPDYVDLAK